MRMVCRNTVEEKLIALQASKRLMSQQAMGSSDGSSTGSNSLGADTGKGNRLSLEELKNLFL
jgi:SNF2 family DNA or RNA helicase